MKCGIIEMRFVAGTAINVACADAINVANTLSVNVEFKFNGTDMLVRGDESIEDLVAAFYVKRDAPKKSPVFTGGFDFEIVPSGTISALKEWLSDGTTDRLVEIARTLK